MELGILEYLSVTIVFVNAEIRGEAQLSVPITRTDYQLFKENKIDALSLVEKYYAEELNASNEMKYGFKR